MKQLNREAIRRMVGDAGMSPGSVVGGGGGVSRIDLTGYATESWVNENYLSIEFFSSLFKAYDSASTPNEIVPNGGDTTAITNIKAMFGFWTEQYLSALGQNSGGGGGGSTTLDGLLDVAITNPQNGDALIYNATSGKWKNQAIGGSTGTLSSIGLVMPTGFSVSPATLTANGSFTVAFATGYGLPLTADVAKGVTAYGWGDHASAGYLTGINATMINTALGFTPLSDATTFWGQSVNNGVVSGSLSSVADITMSGNLTASGTIQAKKFYLSSGVYFELDTNGVHLVGAGLYSDSFISALGQGSGGGGGLSLNEPLSSINNSGLSAPGVSQDGMTLVWDNANSKWKYGSAGGGGGTVTQVNTGTGLTGGPISSTGTISINSTYQSYISHGETAYGWGDHAQAGYLTGINATMINTALGFTLTGTAGTTYNLAGIASNAVDGKTAYGWGDHAQAGYMEGSTTFWGQSVSNGVVSGSIEAGNNGGEIGGFHGIELNTHGSLSGYGGYIDFHYSGTSSDYSTRLIEESAGTLRLYGKLKIGNAFIEWDNDNQCLKIAGSMYATGGVTALG